MTDLPTFDCIPRELKVIPRWILWKYNATGGKIPQGRSGNVSAHDPANWMGFEHAVKVLHRILQNERWSHGGGLGFVFVEDDDIGGVDLDSARDPETGDIAPWAKRVLDIFAPAYVETSPSGSGFHIISRGAPKALARTQREVEADPMVEGKTPAIEAYVTGRYFTFTGNHATGRWDELQVMRNAWVQVDGWLRGDEARHEREAAGKVPQHEIETDIERVRDALSAFCSDDVDRNTWVGIGMALKGEFGDAGKQLWLDWMAKSPNDNAEDNEKTWKGLPERPLKIGIGTIIHYATEAGWKDPRKSARKGSSPTALLVSIIESQAELWHDQRNRPYATVTIERDDTTHRENLPIDSKGGAFSLWVEYAFYRATGGAPKREYLREAVSLAAAKARFDGAQHTTWIRAAEHEGRLYLDLGDPAWQAIEVDKEGWRIIPEAPVKFRRSGETQALPMPVKADVHETLRGLGDLIRPRDPAELKLLLGWLVACMRAGYPIAILVLACESGSAKTSTLRAIRSFVDPHALATPGLPATERDIMVSAHGQWLCSYDNITAITPAQSDILCRIATGGGISNRTLYSDEDVSNLIVKRPVVLTCIGSPTMRQDFVDRTISIELRQIEQADRLTEAEANERLAALQPSLMGLILDGASAALRNQDKARTELASRLPRMSDFAIWADAAGEAFGWVPGEFLDTYLAMLRNRMGETAADDPFVSLLMDWMCSRHEDFVEGSAGELLNVLGNWADRGWEFEPRRRSVTSEPWWPQRPRGLSARLKADRRLLEAIGITYTAHPHPHSSTRGQIYRLELNAKGLEEKEDRSL